MCDISAPAFIYYSYISVFILSFVTAILILLRDRKNRANRYAFFVIFFIALWTLDDFVQWKIRDVELNLLFAKFSGFVDLIFLFFLYFSYHFTNTPISLKKKIAFAIPIFILTPFYFSDYFVRIVDTNSCSFDDGPLMFFLYTLDLVYIIWSSIILSRACKNPKAHYMMKYQVRVILIAIWFLITAGIIYQVLGNVSAFGDLSLDISAYFIISNLIFVSLIAFAIIKCELFNFKFGFKRVAHYSYLVCHIFGIFSFSCQRSFHNSRFHPISSPDVYFLEDVI